MNEPPTPETTPEPTPTPEPMPTPEPTPEPDEKENESSWRKNITDDLKEIKQNFSEVMQRLDTRPEPVTVVMDRPANRSANVPADSSTTQPPTPEATPTPEPTPQPQPASNDPIPVRRGGGVLSRRRR